MSDEAADQIMKRWEEWSERDNRVRFLGRMKHKMHAKERGGH